MNDERIWRIEKSSNGLWSVKVVAKTGSFATVATGNSETAVLKKAANRCRAASDEMALSAKLPTTLELEYFIKDAAAFSTDERTRTLATTLLEAWKKRDM